MPEPVPRGDATSPPNRAEPGAGTYHEFSARLEEHLHRTRRWDLAVAIVLGLLAAAGLWIVAGVTLTETAFEPFITEWHPWRGLVGVVAGLLLIRPIYHRLRARRARRFWLC